MNFHKKLIELVRERKCLYLTRSRLDRNNQKRIEEWQRVSDALQRPVFECRQKWRSLRDRFVRERKKLLAGGASKSELRWEFYDDMEFLIPLVRSRQPKNFRSKRQGGKIYLNPELSSNFFNINNSRDDGSEGNSYDGMNDDEATRTTTPAPQEYKIETISVDTTEELLSEDELNMEEQPNPGQKNEAANFRIAKDEEWNEDYEKYPIIKVSNSSKSNEYEKNFYETVDATPRKVKQSSSSNTTPVADPTGVFVEILNMVKSELNKSSSEEKDENDFFLECMALKMKKLSSRAKLKIQSKLLYNINEELAKEMET